jgi:hypothetical protein
MGGIDIDSTPHNYPFFFSFFFFFLLDILFGFPAVSIDTRLHSFALAIFFFFPISRLDKFSTMKLLLLIAAVAAALVGAQTTGAPDPVADFCNMGGSSSMYSRHSCCEVLDGCETDRGGIFAVAMSGEKAYIFGGWAWYDGYNKSYTGSSKSFPPHGGPVHRLGAQMTSSV